MKIRLEQAVFGEKDRGHSLLTHSFASSKIPNQISLKTDLPSGHTSFPSFKFYYSTISTSEFYVLIKSFPDSSAQRSGFVYSYSLFVKNSDLEYVNDLLSLFSLLPNEIDKEYKVVSLEIESETGTTIKQGNVDKAKKIAYGLLNNKIPIVWLGEEQFLDTTSIIWNNLSPILKSKFQFRVSFGPKDIEQTNEQIIYSPIGLKGKWENFFVIDELDGFDEEYSDDIKCLIENESVDNSIKKNISELEINISSFSDIKKVALLDKFLYDSSYDNLLNSIVLLADLLPGRESGKKLKHEIITKVSSELNKGDINSVLALRNVELKHIIDVSSIKKGIKNILGSWDFDSEATQLLTSVVNNDVQKWWRGTIHKNLIECFTSWNEKHSILFWKLVIEDFSNFKLIENYIPNQNDVESLIAKNMPSNFKSEQGFKLMRLSQEKEWYLIHAILASNFLSSPKAIESQLKIDVLDTHFDGLEIISNNIPPVDFLSYSVEKPEKRLIELSVRLVSDTPSLMNNIDVNNSTWLKIWDARPKTIDVFEGIKSPKKTFYSLLDSLILGNEIPEGILLSASNSKFANISDYENRNSAWGFLTGESYTNTLKSTAQESLNKKLLDSSSIILEPELIQEIERENLFINVPNKEKLTTNTIQLFIEFDEFSENRLIAFLDIVKYSMDRDSCMKLGNLLSQRKWSNTYRKVKSEYSILNSNFKETVKISKSTFPIIEQSFFESIFGKKTTKTNMKKIFVSYSRKDVNFKNNLLTHLKPLEKYSLISAWDCSKIRAGEWDEQIQKELEEADIMIFMVSANFMASDYIIDNEVEKGIELAKKDYSKKIMCVLVRECIWNQWSILDENFNGDGSSDLSRFQFLPYHNSNGEEAILALEDWGKGDSKSVNNAYKQIVQKLMIELK